MSAPAVFTIPPHVAFVDALAQGLLDRTRGAPLALARAQVWLPNRRAVRALTDAFVRLSGGGLLLPHMVPLAAVDGDITSFADDLDTAADLPPPIEPLQRRLLLAQLVRRWPGADLTAIGALRLADQLAAVLDAVAFEEIEPAALLTAVPDDLATHWEATLAYFRQLFALWPPLLAAHGLSDRAAHARALLAGVLARWDAGAVPGGLVVAAGMTAAAPPVARLLARVARLPGGMVVLPGLDAAMPDDEWAAIRCRRTDPDQTAPDSEDHPQFTLKCLLHDLGVARGEVQLWEASSLLDGPADRTAAVARAMSPAAFTTRWRETPVTPALFAGVRTVVATDAGEEAQVIALALRRSLETPGQTAALVTPDRALARRVAAHLARWDIAIDDSAGTPLRNTPPGALLLALVEAAAQRFAPVALLAVLKHPLVQGGDARLGWLDAVRGLDRDLRGVRPAPGLAGMAARCAAAPWWAGVAAMLAPLEAAFAGAETDLAAMTATLRDTAQALCGDEVWRGSAGCALASLVAGLEAHGRDMGAFAPADAPALWAALLGETAVREAYGKQPRLAIYGLLEARLQRADLMILGGLNEGVWPPAAVPDPWLAPALRRSLGLPALERRVGLAAHDFVAAMGARHVLLTRARQGDSAPAVASRLWLRLQALAGDALLPDPDLIGWARALDASAVTVGAKRPRPAPPAALRPRQLSVTAAEKLKADPFSFYADMMLKVRALDPLDAEPGGRERGIAVHAILERWVKAGDLDPAALAAFTEAELARWSGHPLMRALWAPRVRRMMDWVTETLGAWTAEGWTPLAAEARGKVLLGNGITLTGIADRVDRHGDGTLAIIDYKTGAPPSPAQVAGGYALQLGLLGWLAQRGDLDGVAAAPVAALRFWKLGGGKTPGEVVNRLKYGRETTPAPEHIAAVQAHFLALCDDMLLGPAPFTAKLHPDYAEKYRDYDQLARVLEWRGRPEAET